MKPKHKKPYYMVYKADNRCGKDIYDVRPVFIGNVKNNSVEILVYSDYIEYDLWDYMTLKQIKTSFYCDEEEARQKCRELNGFYLI